VIERDGRTFTVRPEKIRVLAADAREGESGVVQTAVYLGPVTRFVVALERGGELSVIQQNLETSSLDVREMEGKRVRLAWRAGAEFVIKEEE
jgi:putative spermidine/putrescine transport system ATP-binding protein